MSGIISRKENELISNFKKNGTLKKFNPEEEMQGLAKNGGVAVICADGDIDAELFHRRISHRPHAIRIFGGPLLFSPNFGGYDEGFARKMIENVKQGMEVKKTRTLYLYFHAPCGLATAFNHEIPEILDLARSVNGSFTSDNFFFRVFTLFHVKRINKGGIMEQNVYLLQV
ncbi:MAG: hypothetical protein HYV53_01365 [Parcubacteria group bacterium]|nr:hypothetical protein [Parcubacteria group bacterium]